MKIVQKYGGTSIADIACIERAALRIKNTVEAGHHVAVVVSAMAGVTNQLVGYTQAIVGNQNNAEYDTVLGTGEQVTAGLLALALQQIGIQARSFMGWQLPIHTTDLHGNAQITRIDCGEIEECWAQGMVPVVAGFQGVNANQRLTTLGRGGSDATAVALCAFLEADICEIYTDVDGVYTADPRLVPDARRLDYIGYEDMLEMAAHGAKVLQTRSVELAQMHYVPLRVVSGFETNPQGTCVLASSASIFGYGEHARVIGLAHSTEWVEVILTNPEIFEKHAAKRLIYRLKQEKIDTEMVCWNYVEEQHQLRFITPLLQVSRVLPLLEEEQAHLKHKSYALVTDLTKVTLIGRNLLQHQEPLGKLLQLQAREALTISGICNHKITVVTPHAQLKHTLNTLHDVLELKNQESPRNVEQIMAARL